jgi:hypothetical protein
MCRLWFLAQIDGFEYGYNGVGWIFWNMKIEQGGCFSKRNIKGAETRENSNILSKRIVSGLHMNLTVF